MIAKGRKPAVALGRALPVASDFTGLPHSAPTVSKLAIAGKRDSDEDPCRFAAKLIASNGAGYRFSSCLHRPASCHPNDATSI